MTLYDRNRNDHFDTAEAAADLCQAREAIQEQHLLQMRMTGLMTRVMVRVVQALRSPTPLLAPVAGL